MVNTKKGKKYMNRFTYYIVYNEYQEKYIVFKTDNVHFNSKSIFHSQKKKDCVEWLKEYKSKENSRNGKQNEGIRKNDIQKEK